MPDNEPSTEAIARKGGVLIRLGSNRWTVPLGTILTGALVALGTAYQVVKNDRDAIHDRIAALEKAHQATENKLAVEAVTLANIQTQLARIDARVAEVQVTLMRGPR